MPRALRRDHHRHRRGRRHAGPPARAVGQADPAARARRLPAARAGELGQPRGLRQRALPVRRAVARQGRRAVQAPPAVLRRRQHQVLRRDPVPAARARLRRGRATTAASRPRGRSTTRTSSPTTPRPSGSTSSTARPARTRPSRRARARSPIPPSRTSRASSSSTTTSSAPATARSTCRSASTSTSRDPEAGRCVRCDRFDGFPCLTDGKADAHVLCVRPALKHPNVTLRTHAKVQRLETDAAGGAVTEVVVDRRGADEVYSADVVVVSCGAANSAALLLRSASDAHPNGLANSSDQVGRNYMAHINSGVIAISQTPNETKFQKTLGVNDYYWGARGLRAAAGPHPDARQVRPQHPARGRALVRPRSGAGLHGQARDRLLADHRGPAAPGQPRHGRPRRARSTSPRRTTTRRRTGGCWASSRACSALGCHARRSRACRSSTSASRWPASPTSAARSASAPTPRRSALDVNCRRTSSTTSTSSTRASSPRPARSTRP